MEIERTSLWREVTSIIQSGENEVHFTPSATIHILDTQTDYKVMKLTELDVSSDFVNNYTDEVFIKVVIPLGDYAYLVYPNRNNLEVTLISSPKNEVGGANNSSSQRAERYVAAIVDQGNPVVDTKSTNSPGRDALNQRGFAEVHIQLLDKAAALLRFAMVGGIWRNCTTEEVVKSIMTNESQRLLVDSKIALQGVDMVPATNTKKRDHVIIPQGTKLVDVPNFVQNKAGGLYSAGLGYYLYKNYWYIYPAFDVTRYNSTTRTVTIINIPENKMPGVERTFKQNGSNVTILATGEVKFKDSRKENQQNMGNGVRYSNSDVFMGGFFTTENNKTSSQRSKTTSEFVADESPTGANFAPISPNRITTNSSRELSALAARRGAFFSLVWEHADPSLIVPGTLANILYLSNGQISSVIGSIVKVHTYVPMEGKGLTDARYVRRCILTFFVEGIVS